MPRPANPARAAEIADAAARLFRDRGYAGTSVRDIAAAAGVDPALVIRHFGSKERLFLDTMQWNERLNPLADGELDTLGERFVEYLLRDDGDARAVFVTLVRASDGGPIGAQLHELHEQAFVAPLRARIPGPDADRRARMAAAAIGGMLYALWIAHDSVLDSDRTRLVREYGRLVQGIITPPPTH